MSTPTRQPTPGNREMKRAIAARKRSISQLHREIAEHKAAIERLEHLVKVDIKHLEVLERHV